MAEEQVTARGSRQKVFLHAYASAASLVRCDRNSIRRRQPLLKEIIASLSTGLRSQRLAVFNCDFALVRCSNLCNDSSSPRYSKAHSGNDSSQCREWHRTPEPIARDLTSYEFARERITDDGSAECEVGTFSWDHMVSTRHRLPTLYERCLEIAQASTTDLLMRYL